MTTKPGSTKKPPTTPTGTIALTHSFIPAPVVNQASDYTLTITNNTGKLLTITRIVIDVGRGQQVATYNLAGESVPPSAAQDFITYQLEWNGSLAIANTASAKILFPGGFTGFPGTVNFPSIILTSTPALSVATFKGPTVTVK